MIGETLEQLVHSKYKNELHDDGFPTTLVDHENFSLLFIRYLSIAEENLVVSSTCFMFIDESVSQYSRESGRFNSLHDDENSFIFAISSILKQNRVVLGHLVDVVEELEESIYGRTIPAHFMDAWFKMKKNLSKIDRYYTRLNSVFLDLVDSKKGEDHLSRYQKLMSRFDFELTRTELMLKKLDGLYNYHELIRSDKLNRNVYLLTIISAVFLPLNLIVGFFGMNTTGLFFAQEANATTKVVAILGGVSLLSVIAIPVLRFIYHFTFGRKLRQFYLFSAALEVVKDPTSLFRSKN